MASWNCADDVPVGEKTTGRVLFTTTRTYDAIEVGSSKGRTYFIVYGVVGMRDAVKGWYIRQIDNPGHRMHGAAPGREGVASPIDHTLYTLSEGIKKAQDVLYQMYNH